MAENRLLKCGRSSTSAPDKTKHRGIENFFLLKIFFFEIKITNTTKLSHFKNKNRGNISWP